MPVRRIVRDLMPNRKSAVCRRIYTHKRLAILILLCGGRIAGAAPSGWANANRIESVGHRGATQVVVYLDSAISYNSQRLSNPDRSFFDLLDTRLNVAPAERD